MVNLRARRGAAVAGADDQGQVDLLRGSIMQSAGKQCKDLRNVGGHLGMGRGDPGVCCSCSALPSGVNRQGARLSGRSAIILAILPTVNTLALPPLYPNNPVW